MSPQRVPKSLIALIADGEFHSGTDLAGFLGVSRSAVWKHLQGLNALGLDVHAVPGKGYRLDRPIQLLSKDEIWADLEPSVVSMIHTLDIQDSTASTNADLMELGALGAPPGHVLLAEHQTAGRGRRGRQWVSPFGNNIYLSLLWRYPEGLASIAGLSLAVGVAVIRALNVLGMEGMSLKWPNDIYWQRRKLGGILVEVSGESSGPCFAVVGLGLNVYLPDAFGKHIDQPWVDFETITGGLPPSFRNRLAASLINALLPVVADFEAGRLQEYLPEWRKVDVLKGEPAALLVGSERIQGIVSGIDDAGLLLLQLPSGEVKAFGSGELTFLRS